MKDISEQGSSSKTVFEDLQLPIDPTTISLALGEKSVKSIEPDGAIVYGETYVWSRSTASMSYLTGF